MPVRRTNALRHDSAPPKTWPRRRLRPRFASTTGGVKGSVSQSLREVSGRRLRFIAKFRNHGFTAAQVLVTAIDKGYTS